MRILKTHALLRFLNSFLVDSPQPANLSYLWNFGSLLATCLGIQILSGAFLAMHYQAHVDFAFNSVEHIMRDVNNGWIIRYMHGAPYDGDIKQTRLVEMMPCLLSVLPIMLRTNGVGEQSVFQEMISGWPQVSNSRGFLYGEVHELETSSWAQYNHSLLSRISWVSLLLSLLMRAAVGILNGSNGTLMRVNYWCEHLSRIVFNICKPGELTASTVTYSSADTRGRSCRSSKKIAKGNSLDELVDQSTLKDNPGSGGPDSPKGERPKDSISSWLKTKLNELRNKDGKYNGLIHVISDPEILYAAYLLIKSKPGNMTHGPDKSTLDGIK